MDKSQKTPLIRLAAAGDLLLGSCPAGARAGRDPSERFAAVRAILGQCDVVFGNLECTLAGDGRTVATEPRVVSTPELVRSVKSAGFNVVSLANNHTFDCLQDGFHSVRRLLDEMSVAHFGAGDDLAEATAPLVLEVGGIRLAFLGAVDEQTSPAQFAGEGRWGVAPLDIDRLTERIRSLRGSADHVIVSVHWGEERFLIPSPSQIDRARAMIDAGASMVLGHHPHVVQGMEFYCGAPIIYSLGNFAANDVHFSDGDVMTWSRTERVGCLLLADLGKAQVTNVRQVATHDTRERVEIDRAGPGAKRIARANRALERGVSPGRYRREHLWVKTIKPVAAHLRWSRLKRFRLRMLRNALAGVFASRKAR